jgi:hypothetical protein
MLLTIEGPAFLDLWNLAAWILCTGLIMYAICITEEDDE